MTAAAPLPDAAPRRQIWSLGGGKGGIGKSLLTASLGWQLARMGKRVVLVDADLGGANLHTCLGLAAPGLTMGDFIRRRVANIEEVAQETGIPGMRLISGASDFLSAANIKYQQKIRVLNRIRALEVDIVLIDLGAGTSFNILDFFLISDIGLLAVVPEPTSIENSYRFIKSALYRRLRDVAPTETVRQIVECALDQKNQYGIRTPLDLLAAVEREAPGQSEVLRHEIAAFHPRFIVNQVRGPADIAIGHQLVTACARHLGIRATYAGFVDYDDTVWQCVRQRRLFAAAFPHCRASEKVARLARGLVQNDGLAFPLVSVDPRTHYEVLGVEPAASPEQLERAYRFCIDLYGETSMVTYSLLDPEETREARARIEEAYGVLRDPHRRRAYDQLHGLERPPGPPTRPADPDGTGGCAVGTVLLAEPATGSALRRFREQKGISLREISLRSKVGVRFLEYIEQERHALLPAPVYLRGFLQEYARVLGLEPRRTAEAYLALLPLQN